MKADTLGSTQLLMAQAIFELADHVSQASGTLMVPVAFDKVPSPPVAGMINCISDSTVNTWGSVIAGGGGFRVLAWYNGTSWTVIAA